MIEHCQRARHNELEIKLEMEKHAFSESAFNVLQESIENESNAESFDAEADIRETCQQLYENYKRSRVFSGRVEWSADYDFVNVIAKYYLQKEEEGFVEGDGENSLDVMIKKYIVSESAFIELAKSLDMSYLKPPGELSSRSVPVFRI